jgi:sialic acid synthase SpsE
MVMHKYFNKSNNDNVFIMADLGLTNGGDLNHALELIDVASELNVDAVKFQMIDSAELLGDKTIEYTYPTLSQGKKTENMYQMFLKLEFSDDDWLVIKNHCDKRDIGLVITSHVESAVERINKLNLPVNKICTWSLNHYKMIGNLAKNGKPLIIDTGTIDLNDLIDLKEFYTKSGGGEIIILYDFHTSELSEMNFNVIQNLKDRGFIVGYTPQGLKDWLDYMAVGLGISVIEKRLTLSKNTPENGHWKAHEPDDFRIWMKNINECRQSLGASELTPTTLDNRDAKKYYKSAWLKSNVEKGSEIHEDLFVYKRPGTGVGSREIYKNYIGKIFEKSFKAGEMFKP